MARLKATTLIESMVAMILIVVSFGIGMMIYFNVLNGTRLQQKMQAELLLNTVLENTKKTSSFVEEAIELNGLIVTKETSPYRSYDNVRLLHLKAYDQKSNFIIDLKEVVYISDK